MGKKRVALSSIIGCSVAAVLVATGAGTAQAATGTKCSSWSPIKAGSNLLMRSCISSDDGGDYGYVQAYNPNSTSVIAGFKVKLYDSGWGSLSNQNSYSYWSVPAAGYRTWYTPYVIDNSWGPESVGGWVTLGGTERYSSVTESWY
ncbi:hypothetical protein ACIGBL_34050 [Streptomyces sp. NPDC085614]|uniref:hypothetical protein n=1 Tax=Streptomyces sp. NPDC085614 TaxID=3365733 RepID=UPI0037D30921